MQTGGREQRHAPCASASAADPSTMHRVVGDALRRPVRRRPGDSADDTRLRCRMRRVVLPFLGLLALHVVGCEGQAPSLPPPGPGASPITIVSTPPGAGVTVNGFPVGPAPVTVQLNPGPVRLRATMSGYYPAPETRVVVERGTAAIHTIALVASH